MSVIIIIIKLEFKFFSSPVEWKAEQIQMMEVPFAYC